jgi:hypothetical protein
MRALNPGAAVQQIRARRKFDLLLAEGFDGAAVAEA